MRKHEFIPRMGYSSLPYAAETVGDKYEEMIDAFEQFNNIFRKSTVILYMKMMIHDFHEFSAHLTAMRV